MPVALQVWSIKLESGEAESITPYGDLRITNIALGEDINDNNSRNSVKLIYKKPVLGEEEDEDDEEVHEDERGPFVMDNTVLGSLIPGKIEQVTVDIILEADVEYVLENKGKNTVYLTGNYIDQGGDIGDDESGLDSEEEDYDLEDIPSDVELDPSEMDIPSDDDRFEEVDDEEPVEEEQKASKPKPESKDSKKRPRESDSIDTEESKLSKAERKKLNKKLKADGGKAIPAGAEEAAPSEGKKEKKEKTEKKEKKEKEKEGSLASPAVTEKAGGLKIADYKVGSGRQAKKGDWVFMRYIGKLTNGKEFDKNTKGKPLRFQLGSGEVIKGWDEGIVGMRVGGERRLTVPGPLAYGKKGSPPVIPPNATLTFDLKLVKIG